MTQKSIQSIPVVRASARDYELAALVGDDAVILGWTMSDMIDRSDLLGFAVKRVCRNADTQHETESRWLSNHRRFALRGAAPESTYISSQNDPLQQFHFLDYDVEPGSSYTYSMVPVRGTPTLKYFEAPVSITVHPQYPCTQGLEPYVAAAEGLETRSESAVGRNLFVPGPGAQQAYRLMGKRELADEVQRMTDRARSAVFLYSTVELPDHLTEVVSRINSGRLLYGLAPDRQRDQGTGSRPHKTVHLSRPVPEQKLDPLTFMSGGNNDVLRYTSALVTDPWSRSPGILLWSDTPRVTPEPVIDTRTITRDKRSAARLATSIFQAYASGRLMHSGRRSRRPLEDTRNLEPDGRWSNIYFSRHAASHKFREREIFAGRP